MLVAPDHSDEGLLDQAEELARVRAHHLSRLER